MWSIRVEGWAWSVRVESWAWSMRAEGWVWLARVGAVVAGECVRGGEGAELAGWMVGGGVRVSGETVDPLVCVTEEGIAGVTGAGVVTGCVVRTEAGWLGSEEGVAT